MTLNRPVATAVVLAWAVVASASAQPSFGPDTVGAPRSGEAGELFLPAGPGPFPAMIVLHGCNGVAPHYRNWARRLNGWRYAALLVDSFGPRGFREVCGHGRDVEPAAQALDGLHAATYLRTRPDIVPSRVGVIGFSHGGWAVMKAVLSDAVAASDTPPFAAAVAYYPGCERPTAAMATDTLILIGDADDWTPPPPCLRWTQAVTRDGHALDIVVYPGAVHGFDTMAPRHVYVGHQVGGDPAAKADAETRVRAFLASHLDR